MFKVGEVVQINATYDKFSCLITQVLPGQVCAIDLDTANRLFEPVGVDDLTNIQAKDIIKSQFFDNYTIVKLADSFREYMENETKKNTKNSEVVKSPVKTYSVDDTIVMSESGEEYKIVPLMIVGKSHIILINKKSFTRWVDPVEVGAWYRITQDEMKEVIGNNNFYKKEN